MHSEAIEALQGLLKQLEAPLPKGLRWIDDARYLVLARPAPDTTSDAPGAEGEAAEGAPVVETPEQILRVEAATGASEPLFDLEAMTAALSGALRLDDEAARNVATRKDLVLRPGNGGAVTVHEGRLVALDFDPPAARVLVDKGHSHDPDVQGPQFAPDGETLGFVRDQDLHVVPFEGGAVRRLTDDGAEERLNGRLDWVYQEEIYGRGTWDGFWWSPDSARIAFLQLDESPVARYPVFDHMPVLGKEEVWRYPKAGEPNPIARVGCVDAVGGPVTWIALKEPAAAEHLIVSVGWNPEATRVVLQVADRTYARLELLLADPVTGAAERVLEESGRPWVRRSPVHWIDARRFTWTSTRTGWRHLYLHDLDGNSTTALTSGEFEVLDVAGVRDGRAVVVSNEGDLRQRHVWAVPLDGSPRKRLTGGRGVHALIASPGVRLAVHRSDNAEHPGTAELIDLADGGALRRLAESKAELLAGHGVVVPRFVSIPREGDDALEAMLWLPPDAPADTPLPTLVSVYGGPHAPLVRDQWAGIGGLWRSHLARQGIAVCVVDPHSASGRGDRAAYRMHRRAGATELLDVHTAMDWLVARGTSDPARFGIFGWSYGGFMASYAMTHSTRFKAGIAGAPVTDWRNYDSVYTETYMGTPQDNPDGYEAASVVGAAASLSGELLLIHGTLDENVHVSNSIQLAKALQTAGKDFRMMLYPSSRHGVTEPKLQAHLYGMMTAFLVETLIA